MQVNCHNQINFRALSNLYNNMLKGYLIIFITCLLGPGCKNKIKTEEVAVTADTTAMENADKKEAGSCYLAITGMDSILMHIVIENTAVAGHLHYRFSEKDKSGGNLFGIMRGDTLVADYKFIAEGMESEREVAFLKRGEEFIEGYGEVEEKDGRVVFRNLSSLKFEGKPMQLTDCAALSWYFNK